MSARRESGRYHNVARKWLDLAERRKAHFTELYDSGRWKRYYTEAQMVAQMRGSITACNSWAKIVGDPSPADELQPELNPLLQRYRA